MSKSFKEKWKAYTEGKLSDAEAAEFEREIQRLEEYQEVLKQLEKEEQERSNVEKKADPYHPSKQIDYKKILTKGKWKARIQISLLSVLILISIFVIPTIITSIYYTSDRADDLREVVRHTVAVTEPNIRSSLSGTRVNPFFSRSEEMSLLKTIGNESIQVGELNIKYLFSHIKDLELSYNLEKDHQRYTFVHPDEFRYGYGVQQQKEWETLDKLPEGTVSEVFFSLDQLYTIDEVQILIGDRDVELLWYAVDTGIESNMYEEYVYPIGMPKDVMWLNEDFIYGPVVDNREGWFRKTTSQGSHTPMYTEEEHAQILEQQFIKVLKFLDENEKMVKRLLYGHDLRLKERITYLEDYGATIYGMVLTGPTKELLALQDQDWIEEIKVGEVRFWNW